MRYGKIDQLTFRLVALIMLVSPFMWGISRPMTILIIELLCLPLLWIVFSQGKLLLDGYTKIIYLMAALIGFTVLQLIPVPMDIWESLPARGEFREIFAYLSPDYLHAWRAVSVIPQATESALLFLLPSIAVFLAALLLDKNLLVKLLLLGIAVAVFQSVLGLMQYGGGIQSLESSGAARGTYLNRDHLAGFLAMMFPLVLAMLASMIGPQADKALTRRGRHRFIASLQGNQSIIYAAIAVLLILCLIFTRSRAGITLVMVGMLISLVAYSYRLGRGNTYGIYGTVIAVITILALEIGLTPVLDRFSVDHMQDLRWEIYAITLRAIGDYFPLGSGMGTFSDIYAAYQLPNSDGFINHAHNDYLQWLLEGGLPMLLVMVYGLFLYFSHWRRVWLKGQWGGFRYLQVGAGIGILLVLLHSTLDFGLHKPANNIYFALLMAIYFKNNERKKTIRPA